MGSPFTVLNCYIFQLRVLNGKPISVSMSVSFIMTSLLHHRLFGCWVPMFPSIFKGWIVWTLSVEQTFASLNELNLDWNRSSSYYLLKWVDWFHAKLMFLSFYYLKVISLEMSTKWLAFIFNCSLILCKYLP